MSINSSERIFEETITGSHSIRLDYDGSGNLIYIGRCLLPIVNLASPDADAIWQIRKLTYDGSNNVTAIKYADGNDQYDNIWNNRTSLTYQ